MWLDAVLFVQLLVNQSLDIVGQVEEDTTVFLTGSIVQQSVLDESVFRQVLVDLHLCFVDTVHSKVWQSQGQVYLACEDDFDHHTHLIGCEDCHLLVHECLNIRKAQTNCHLYGFLVSFGNIDSNSLHAQAHNTGGDGNIDTSGNHYHKSLECKCEIVCICFTVLDGVSIKKYHHQIFDYMTSYYGKFSTLLIFT